MPLHKRNASHGSEPFVGQSNRFGTAANTFHASQNLGHVPTLSEDFLRKPVDTTPGRTDDLFLSSTHAPRNNGYSIPGTFIDTMPVGVGNSGAPKNIHSNPYPPAQYQTPREASTYGRQPEELHISSAQPAMSDMHRYQAPPAYGGGDSLSINLQPSTPQHSNSAIGSAVPGALQPGPVGRPGPLSSNTAPGSIPTLPQISTQLQQPPMSARPGAMNHSHSYSRSSPTGMEQVKYKAFANTPEGSRYDPSNRMPIPHTPQSSSYSPLGLADIRPRADTGFSDELTSPTFYTGTGEQQQYPTNSNYLAPWPIYASDWCKWPSRSSDTSAGRIAIGSYMEDNHNFVCSEISLISCKWRLTIAPRYKFSTPKDRN